MRVSTSHLFFSWLVAILKDFSYLFVAKFTGRKFNRWDHDNCPTGQWVKFHPAPNTPYANFFSRHEVIIWLKSIQAKQVDLHTSSPARSVAVRSNELKLASLTFKNLWEVDLWQVYVKVVNTASVQALSFFQSRKICRWCRKLLKTQRNKRNTNEAMLTCLCCRKYVLIQDHRLFCKKPKGSKRKKKRKKKSKHPEARRQSSDGWIQWRHRRTGNTCFIGRISFLAMPLCAFSKK